MSDNILKKDYLKSKYMSLLISDIDFTIDFEYVWNQYNEPHRVYHDWQHIYKMFKSLDLFLMYTDRKLKVDTNAIGFGIFFHDIRYIPGDKENEKNSLITFLSGDSGIWNHYTQLVSLMILASKDHLCHEYMPDEVKLFVDLDLMGMVCPIEYKINALNIYKEYVTLGGIKRDAFISGRKEFLNNYICRKDKIFHMHPKSFSYAALTNMSYELDELTLNGNWIYPLSEQPDIVLSMD